MMKQLNKDILTQTDTGISLPAYHRSAVTAGIVHFGVGNFHRTHQAIYCDNLLNAGNTNWGIIGVSMRSPNIRDILAPQDFLYTEATLSEDIQLRVVGSLLKILVAPESPKAVIQAVADNQTQVVTTTITEKGYCITSGIIDTNHLGISQDQASLNSPQTIYGYLAASIIERSQNNGSPFTVLCCDNMQSGGEYLKAGVNMMLDKHSPAAKVWAKHQVAFSSSMVDRVSPATDTHLKQQVKSQAGLIDEWPVSAEPFSEWIIEDRFVGERPAFDQVGALFVDHIAPYEKMKLRFLNAGHSIISAVGYLTGKKTIHQAVENAAILRFVQQTLLKNVLPVTSIPQGSDGKNYIRLVLQRFQNKALPYAVLQVGTDSSQKIQQRWFPTIDDALREQSDVSYWAFSLAAWVAYIERAIDKGELNDPLLESFTKQDTKKTNPVNVFLALAGAERFSFFNCGEFMTSVCNHYQLISNDGADKALDDCLQYIEELSNA